MVNGDTYKVSLEFTTSQWSSIRNTLEEIIQIDQIRQYHRPEAHAFDQRIIDKINKALENL